MMRVVLNKAKSDLKRLVFAFGQDEKMIRAAAQIQDKDIAKPLLVGDRTEIAETVSYLGLKFEPNIVDS